LLAASLLELAIKIVIGCDAPGQLVPDLSLAKTGIRRTRILAEL